MANERMDDAKRAAPASEVEDNPVTKRDRPTGSNKDVDKVKTDEVLDDRFQATDN